MLLTSRGQGSEGLPQALFYTAYDAEIYLIFFSDLAWSWAISLGHS